MEKERVARKSCSCSEKSFKNFGNKNNFTRERRESSNERLGQPFCPMQTDLRKISKENICLPWLEARVCLWHFLDGATFEVAFHKWARFDSKRSTKVCASDDVFNSAAAAVEVVVQCSRQNSAKSEGLKYAMKRHRSNIKFKAEIKVLKYEKYQSRIKQILPYEVPIQCTDPCGISGYPKIVL